MKRSSGCDLMLQSSRTHLNAVKGMLHKYSISH